MKRRNLSLIRLERNLRAARIRGLHSAQLEILTQLIRYELYYKGRA